MGNQTNHYKNKRYKREKFINEHLCGDGKVIDSFIVNKGHKDGLERHDITDTGLIIVYNLESKKLVTKLIARENQVKRYYKNVDRNPPRWLLDLCKWHNSLNYNRV
jgi:hypothetical protein